MNSGNILENEKLKQVNIKAEFDNLKSDYFFEILLNIMKKKKSLEIFKFNKKLQKRLNLTINDYKDYSQLYSPIEIELRVIIVA